MALNLNKRYEPANARKQQSCCGSHRDVTLCDPRTVTSILRDGDDVIITFEDCTLIRAPFSVVRDNVKVGGNIPVEYIERLQAVEELTQQLQAKMEQVSKLETKLTALINAIEPVNTFDGKTSFKAISNSYGENQ